jgi:hypothetical protein
MEYEVILFRSDVTNSDILPYFFIRRVWRNRVSLYWGCECAIVPAADDRQENGWTIIDRRISQFSEKTCPSSTLSTTRRSAWAELGVKSGSGRGKPATELLSIGTTHELQYTSQSYFTTGGSSPISLSWRQTPWDPWPELLLSNWTFAVIASSQLLLALASAVTLRSEFRGAHEHILLSQIRYFPNVEDQVPVFISPRNRVGRLYPQALGSLLVASYYCQGYGGGIWTRLHMGLQYAMCLSYHIKALWRDAWMPE